MPKYAGINAIPKQRNVATGYSAVVSTRNQKGVMTPFRQGAIPKIKSYQLSSPSSPPVNFLEPFRYELNAPKKAPSQEKLKGHGRVSDRRTKNLFKHDCMCFPM